MIALVSPNPSTRLTTSERSGPNCHREDAHDADLCAMTAGDERDRQQRDDDGARPPSGADALA
jgi:hypothetical protein